MQLRDSARRHREVQARRAPDALRGRAEEGAGDAHVVVVGRADVHHQVGGRAQPVPAAKGVASPRRQRVGAHDVPGEGAQGHGIALQLEASHREAGQGHGALAAHQKISKRGERGFQQHLAQGGQRDVVGPSVEELVLQQQGRGRRVLLLRVAGLQGCVQDLEAVDVHRSCRLVGHTFLISGFNNNISSISFLITGHNNTLASHVVVLTTHDSDIATNTNGIGILNNTIGSNMRFVNSQNTITSHISLIDTNLNNIAGHGNTIPTIVTDIADLQAGAGAPWTTTEKTTIQANVSTLYTHDTNLFNTNTAHNNTFASIISDNATQGLLITQNSNTINSLVSAGLQKLDKTITTAQTMNSPLIISLTDTTNPIFRIQDSVSNQRLEFKRGCQLDSYQGLTGATPYRLWLGWNAGGVIIGRPNNASRITINGNVHASYSFAQAHGTSYFEGAVYMKGNLFTNNDFSTDIKTKMIN